MNISTTAKVQQIVTNDHSVSVTLVSEQPKLTITIVSLGTALDSIQRSASYNLELSDAHQV